MNPASASNLKARIDWLCAQPYFAMLAERDLAFLAEHFIEREFAKGEVVFLEGEPCVGLNIVVEGQARIYKLSPEGREQVLRYIPQGHSFNEVAVFDGGSNPANVAAAVPSRIWILPRETFIEFVRTHPDMALAIIQNLGGQLRHMVGLVENLSLRQVGARLAKLLLELASSAQPAPLLTQQEMAARLGTVREMVGRSLKQLEARGLVKIERGQIVILDRNALEKLI